MKVLIIHNEAQYFGGAEAVLGYLLGELVRTDCMVTVAAVRGSRFASLIPERIPKIWITDNSRLSPIKILRQVAGLKRLAGEGGWDWVHGWAVRDWDLASILGFLTRSQVLATLHDHPQAPYLSRKRQALMRFWAQRGISRLVCVSAAVREACLGAGYPSSKLVVIPNGLPPGPAPEAADRKPVVRLGYLGIFSEQKGIRTLFEIADELSRLPMPPWELVLAGEVQEETGRKAMAEIRERYETSSWWSNVRQFGWVRQPLEFLRLIDILVFPSLSFDSLPTVLLEAGMAGIPVVSSRIGGAAEIVLDGETGWLFEPGDALQAARLIARLANDSRLRYQAGEAAGERVRVEYSVEKMMGGYLRAYSAR